MVKTFIPFALLAISASFVLAKVPEISRREASDNDLVARDSGETMFSREDNVALEQREPFGFLAPIVGRIASRVGRHVMNRRRRDLEPEDEVDFATREEDGLLARDSGETMLSREDNVALEQREPFGFLAPLVGRIASRVGRHVMNRRRRDLEPEDEVDFAAREEDGDEMFERDVDMIEREMSDEDILSRELDEDLYYLD